VLKVCGWRLGKSSFGEFVGAVGDLLGGDVHGVAQVPSTHIPDEGASSLNVNSGVFPDVHLGLIGGKHNVGRVESQVIELTVWREVVLAVD